jgi:hypothetical protein
MLLTALLREYSLNVVIWPSISGGERPAYVQTTLMTGMSTDGKMSFGIRHAEMTPRIITRTDRTTKVYGRRSASLTIHIQALRFPREGRGERCVSPPKTVVTRSRTNAVEMG